MSGGLTQQDQVDKEFPTASDNVPKHEHEQESGEEDLTSRESPADQVVHIDDAEEHVEEVEVVKPKGTKRKRDDIVKCPWTKNHESKLTLQKDKKMMDLIVKDKFGLPAAGL